MEIRTYHDSIPMCPTLFNPIQCHPRELLQQALSCWVGWMRDNICSLQNMVTEHKSSVVVAGARLEYTDDLFFPDWDTIDVQTTSYLHRKGILIEGRTRFHAGTSAFANVTIFFRPVSIGDEESASAKSSQLLPALQKMFLANEFLEKNDKRQARLLMTNIQEKGTLIATGKRPFRLYRYAMDFADQWAFMESYAFVSAAREEIILAESSEGNALLNGLSGRLKKFFIDLKKPYFLFDHGLVSSEAYTYDGNLFFIHELLDHHSGAVHAVVIEKF